MQIMRATIVRPLAVWMLIVALFGAGCSQPLPTPTPSATPTPIPDPIATPTPTPTATFAPNPTSTATSTATPSPTPTPTSTATPSPTPTYTPTPTSTVTPTFTPTPTPTPLPPYEPLNSDELKAKMDFIFRSTSPVIGVVTVFTGDSATTQEQSFTDEIVEVFVMGYYMLTSKTPHEEGWIPRILSKEEYEALVDECCQSSFELKRALGFCCLKSANSKGLELIIRGNESLPSVLLTLAHEAGHARQHVLNPDQGDAANDTNMGAVREAEAFAFEVAMGRALGMATSLNVSKLPDWPSARDVINRWAIFAREDVNDLTQEHNRGLLLLWLAVLHDPLLKDVSRNYPYQTAWTQVTHHPRREPS